MLSPRVPHHLPNRGITRSTHRAVRPLEGSQDQDVNQTGSAPLNLITDYFADARHQEQEGFPIDQILSIRRRVGRMEQPLCV